MTRTSRTLAYLVIGTIGVGVIVIVSVAVRRRSAAPAPEPKQVLMLVRAREYRPVLSPYDDFPASADFMTLRQHFPEPDITRPVSVASPDLEAIEFGCGLLTIVIAADRTLKLNSSDIGTLDDTNQLVSKISEVFRR